MIHSSSIQRKREGFTLIELLVVIAIIGLLSTLAVVSLNSARARSRDTKRIADVKEVQTALELFYNDNQGYPLAGSADADGNIPPLSTSGDPAFSTFMKNSPVAPKPADGTACASDNKYVYKGLKSDGSTACDAVGNCATYSVDFCVGNKTGTIASGKNIAKPTGIEAAP